MWTGSVVFSEGEWEITVTITGFGSEREATWVVTNAAATWKLALDKQVPAIRVSIDGRNSYYYDADVVIKELTPQKRSQMSGLDKSIDVVFASVIAGERDYIIEEEDMVPTDKTLVDFLEQYGSGYNLEPIAYGVEEV